MHAETIESGKGGCARGHTKCNNRKEVRDTDDPEDERCGASTDLLSVSMSHRVPLWGRYGRKEAMLNGPLTIIRVNIETYPASESLGLFLSALLMSSPTTARDDFARNRSTSRRNSSFPGKMISPIHPGSLENAALFTDDARAALAWKSCASG